MYTMAVFTHVAGLPLYFNVTAVFKKSQEWNQQWNCCDQWISLQLQIKFMWCFHVEYNFKFEL